MPPDIRLDSYYLGDALACRLMGRYGPETMIQDAQRLLKTMWGPDRPTLVVPPGPDLDPYPRACLAWLHGPAKENSDGTHLVVIWFTDEDPTNPLQDALAHVERNGGWDAHAQGFWY